MDELLQKMQDLNSLSKAAPIYCTIFDDGSGALYDVATDGIVDEFETLEGLLRLLDRKISDCAPMQQGWL